MFKGGGRTTDGQLVMFGLSAENIRRMQAGEPIATTLAEFGMPTVIVYLFAGETEEEMATQLQDLIGAATKVTVDPRLFGGSD